MSIIKQELYLSEEEEQELQQGYLEYMLEVLEELHKEEEYYEWVETYSLPGKQIWGEYPNQTGEDK